MGIQSDFGQVKLMLSAGNMAFHMQVKHSLYQIGKMSHTHFASVHTFVVPVILGYKPYKTNSKYC